MINFFINNQYCYEYLTESISVGLLLYSHILTLVSAFLFGFFVFYKKRNLISTLLLLVCLNFGIWCILDLLIWFAFLGSDTVMFAWSIIEIFGILLFLLSYYFLRVFIFSRDVYFFEKIIFILILLPVIFSIFNGNILNGFSDYTCEAYENSYVVNYVSIVESLIIVAVLILTLSSYLNKNFDIEKRKKALYAGVGTFLFLLLFSLSGSLAEILINLGVRQAYNFGIYGLFGMPIMLAFLGYLIVKFKAFDIKLVGAQALIVSLVVLIGSQFLFIRNVVNIWLTSVSLIFTGVIGINLIRSVKKEVEQREKIERLAGDLSIANNKQTALLHFITHQVKGFFTKSRGIYSMIAEGDFGPVDQSLKTAAEEGLASDTRAVAMVQEILSASNMKKGTVEYKQEPVNLKNIVSDIVDVLKKDATAKGIELNLKIADGDYVVTGDGEQLKHAVKNLIDNAVRYTLRGSVNVFLEKKGEKNILKVVDTGVGISKEDFSRLFTEGGRGKDSVKINTDSTGYGLFIVKGIIEAHKGKVWAESAGPGQGATFTVEV